MKNLDPDLLLRAYAIGVFPMSDSRDARGSAAITKAMTPPSE